MKLAGKNSTATLLKQVEFAEGSRSARLAVVHGYSEVVIVRMFGTVQAAFESVPRLQVVQVAPQAIICYTPRHSVNPWSAR